MHKMKLTVNQEYDVGVVTTFKGVFKRYEINSNGVRVAVFVQDGVTDRGSIPQRTVPVDNIVSAETVGKVVNIWKNVGKE